MWGFLRYNPRAGLGTFFDIKKRMDETKVWNFSARGHLPSLLVMTVAF